MPNFRFNDGEIEVPQNWEDKTVVALSFPTGAKQPSATMTITREPAKEASLATYIDKQLVNMVKTFPRYELLKREEVMVDHQPAIQLEFIWRTPDNIFVHQQQTILLTPQKVVLTFTATTQKGKFKEHEKTFQSFIQSFRIQSKV